MNFQQFTKHLKEKICGVQIKEESECQGHNILLSVDGKVFVDFKATELESIGEAKQYIEQIHFEEEIAKDLYEEIPHIKIANLPKCCISTAIKVPIRTVTICRNTVLY